MKVFGGVSVGDIDLGDVNVFFKKSVDFLEALIFKWKYVFIAGICMMC